MENKKTVTLTVDQASKLEMVLRMTKRYRTEEEAACKSMGEEKECDGTSRYPNLKANGEWWEAANKAIEEIIELI